MANKREQDAPERGKTTADYYKLNTQAIEDLASANSANSPEVSAKELKQYGARRHLKLSQWAKAVLIKAWFNGVICYFFLWGLGGYISDSLDLWLVTAIALGFVTDIVTNSLLRLTEKEEGAAQRWMMFGQKKKFITLPLNVGYSILLMALTVMTYGALNRVIRLGVEPILFGIVTLGWDLMLIQFKLLFKTILADARAKTAAGRSGKHESDV